MSKNLVKYPNTKNYYITEDGEVVKIITGNFESDRNRYVFTEKIKRDINVQLRKLKNYIMNLLELMIMNLCLEMN